MMKRTSSPAAATHAVSRRRRIQVSDRAAFRFRRIRSSIWTPAPAWEEVEERLRNYRGFFASLTPGEVALWKSLDEGGAICGDPTRPKRMY